MIDGTLVFGMMVVVDCGVGVRVNLFVVAVFAC